MTTIIGRENEQKELQRYLSSDSSEFIAVYGRRRVGKTFLVRQFFNNKFDFCLTGLANANMSSQLLNFQFAMKEASITDVPLAKNWLIAFQQLKSLIEKSATGKKIIFLDELPWMDTAKSDFLSALEHFWNGWAAHRTDILLIVCGSSTSWMMDKLINNKGGLHNRITHRLKIDPFTLAECKEFILSRGITWEEYQIVECYMVMGGIPFYWSLLKKGLSLAQNIDLLLFHDNGTLHNEYSNLYAALFKNSEKYTQLIEVLSKKSKGMTRNELISIANEKSGGGMTKLLEDLENCGFIRSYFPIDKKVKDKIYQLIDFYSLFYFHFIQSAHLNNDGYWSSMIDSPIHRTWSGYAFEQVCLAHVLQIKNKLGISGVHCNIASWRSKETDPGAQIDLLIDRNDWVINLCEMKYSMYPFTIDKKYSETLRNKIGSFKQETKTRKSIFLTMITTFGIKQNEYAGMVQYQLTMTDLFRK
jgi:AAA+ ATPase superfamily predicted ATPase